MQDRATLREFLDPPPQATDRRTPVPDVDDDRPLYQLPPIDAPAQTRPTDTDAKGRPKLRYLSRLQWRIASKLAEALVRPPNDEYAIPPTDVGLNIDRYLAASRSPMRLQIRAALLLLNVWPTLTGLRRPFIWMSLPARRKWTDRFLHNRGLLMPKLAKLKNLIFLNYYTDPRTDAHTGFSQVLDRDPEFAQVRDELRKQIWA
jgi:hypothetical protein